MSKSVWVGVWVLWCVVASWSHPVQAQVRSVSGIVVDQANLPVAEARVSVGPAGAPPVGVTLTDRDGRFSLGVVPSAPSPMVVVVRRPGFAVAQVSMDADPAAPLRVVLSPLPVSERVTVVSPLVESTAVDGFGALSTSVSASQIEQLNAVDLASALRRTPGVTISRVNPVGAFGGESGGAVFVRGAGSSRPGSEIKTYIEGVPFYMGIWGHPLLDLLPVSALSSVDVHKGPQPQRFGNAFSAIDLSLRRAGLDVLDGSLRVSAGAFATLLQQAEASGRLGRWDVAVSQGFARSNGHRDDADGRLASVSGRVGYRLGRGWSMAAAVLHADNIARDPGLIGQPATRTGQFGTQGTLGTATVAHAHDRAAGTLQVYTNRGEGDWRGQPAPDGDTLTRFALAGVRWREQVRPWTGAVLAGGLDLDTIDGDVQFDRVQPAPRTRFTAERLTLTSPHLALTQVVDVARGWSLQPSVGLRVYEHSVFASTSAPHAGVVVRMPRAAAVRVRYARGVSYPGQEVAALSSLIPPLGETWRQLRPEVQQHVEVGLAWAPVAATSLDVAVFRDRNDRRYVFGFPPAVARPTFTNIGAHVVRGVEASLQQRLASRWQAFLGLTWLDTSVALPYAPSQSIVAGLTGAIGPVRVALDAQHQSSMAVLARARSPIASNTERVAGFTVVNVRPSWTVPRSQGAVDLFVAVENLFDETYAYRPGYPMPGVSAQVGVTLRGRLR